MNLTRRLLMALCSLLVFHPAGYGQTASADSLASISGRVTTHGKGIAGITVTATTNNPLEARIAAKATTDDEGNYRITGLPAARYLVTPIAKAYATSTSGTTNPQLGRTINAVAGEEITRIDFALVRGGVITGRITDADGAPIIGESVSVVPSNVTVTPQAPVSFQSARGLTDDRGIFRSYGLAPGTYKVSVGQEKPEAAGTIFRRGSQYVKTFYPGVQDESKATLIEIKEGSEVKDIDIRTSKGVRGFSATGRVVDASNKPAANVFVAYTTVDDSKRDTGGMNFSPAPTDVNGKFSLDGLQPGKYAAYTMGITSDNTSYSELTSFQIVDSDVSGIEIKLNRGGTVSGVAIIENNPDPTVAQVLSTVSIYGFTDRKAAEAPSYARTRINADGSFKLSGLAPGKLKIFVQEFPKPPKSLRLMRVELNGVDQAEGIEVTAGAQITDLRLVFSYGGGSLRGVVKVTGGTLPEGTAWYLEVASPAGRGFRTIVEVDSRGHFFAESIPSGSYELTLRRAMRQSDANRFAPIKREVTIRHGAETEVVFEVDLKAGSANPD